MTNRVFLSSNHIIEIDYRGLQSAETIEPLLDASLRLTQQMRALGLPIKVLVDLQYADRGSVEGRRMVAQAFRTFKYDKIALYGGPSFIRKSIDLIVRATHRGDKVKVFETRLEAEQWLGVRQGTPVYTPKSAPPPKKKDVSLAVYRDQVKQHIDQLKHIFSGIVIGDYSQEVTIPKDDDEFAEIFVGLQVMIDTLRYKRGKLLKLDQFMSEWQKKEHNPLTETDEKPAKGKRKAKN